MAAEWEVHRKGLDLESQFCLNPLFSLILALFLDCLKSSCGSPSGVSLRKWACKAELLVEVCVGARGDSTSSWKKNH